MNKPSRSTIDMVIRINDIILKHLTEQNCHHNIKKIIQEAFLPDENNSHWASNPTTQTPTTQSRPELTLAEEEAMNYDYPYFQKTA